MSIWSKETQKTDNILFEWEAEELQPVEEAVANVNRSVKLEIIPDQFFIGNYQVQLREDTPIVFEKYCVTFTFQDGREEIIEKDDFDLVTATSPCRMPGQITISVRPRALERFWERNEPLRAQVKRSVIDSDHARYWTFTAKAFDPFCGCETIFARISIDVEHNNKSRSYRTTFAVLKMVLEGMVSSEVIQWFDRPAADAARYHNMYGLELVVADGRAMWAPRRQ